ncbi:MAG: hypothetical protein WAU24_14350 [Chitinophagaceae bacterium]
MATVSGRRNTISPPAASRKTYDILNDTKMKQLTIFFLFLSSISYSQSLKDKLQGEWVCTKILDTTGNKISGKFGSSDDYLKFDFAKGNLSITRAPFDEGIKMPIKFGNDYIDLFPQAVYDLPERKYTVYLVTDDSLILKTNNNMNESIYYYFINQQGLLKKISNNQINIDEGFVIIKHLKLSKDSKGANRVSDYQINNQLENLYLSPIFNDNASAVFGDYFSINFTFPKTYQPDTISNELIIDFDVTDKGVQNIKMIQGLDDEINASVIKIIEMTKNKWQPVKIDGQLMDATLRFHFVFYLSIQNLGLNFKN